MQINNVITFGDSKPMTWQQALEQMMEDAKRMRERADAGK